VTARAVRFWKTRSTDRVDRRPKRVRDDVADMVVEAVRPSAYHQCARQPCPEHDVIAPHSHMVRVYDYNRMRFINGKAVPEVSTYHPACVPEALREAVGMLAW
jgi:hypothetical protein